MSARMFSPSRNLLRASELLISFAGSLIQFCPLRSLWYAV
jgi:hypothetical protein